MVKFSFRIRGDGMLGEFENKKTIRGKLSDYKSRQFYISLDIDFSKLKLILSYKSI